MENQAR